MSVKVTCEEDFAGREVYVITSSNAKITRKIALEALQTYGYVPGVLIQILQPNGLSGELYEKGDRWELYNPDDLAGHDNMRVPAKPVNGKCPMCISPVTDDYTYCPTCGQLLK